MTDSDLAVPRIEREEWERLWREHWSTQDASSYELAPAEGSETEFLSQVRSPDGSANGWNGSSPNLKRDSAGCIS